MKKLMLILVLIINTNLVFAPLSYVKYDVKPKQLEENIFMLKSIEFTEKDRERVFYLIKPLLTEYLKSERAFVNMDLDELSNCISILFISESSTSKGYPASNSLFRKHNNPFGIKGCGIKQNTWEQVGSDKIYMKLSFKTFTTLKESVDYLLENILLTNRYKLLRTSNNEREFFINLYKCGYMTDQKWATFATKLLTKIKATNH